ncbi:TetR/AcrR family transcriptional regulator [Lentzea flava]|uniref:TetR family transcriptional regulator n=1 Tax=Lentzea flava TaxID=103732 RepID=A0ABQ2UDT6_9PSEU|nr:TetR/AcrR family transcriptional regulator [Lentzea flava]MCP2198377.1 transcriptional regulator, TetR family [Lentzea flava]GGU25437.1 TetR family transcriptional regulator [Lentzea flava]
MARSGPRTFDRDAALEAATLVFWEHGYSGTSISQLTAAMKINPPSLYAAFGDKRALFTEVVNRYNATYGRFMADAFAEETTATGLVHRLIMGAAEHYAEGSHPPGCLVIAAAANNSPGNAEVSIELADRRNANRDLLQSRIADAIRSGELPADTDARGLATYVVAVIQGMSQQARDGVNTETLMAVGEMALRTWPVQPMSAAGRRG